jgi:hypothetical protein
MRDAIGDSEAMNDYCLSATLVVEKLGNQNINWNMVIQSMKV